MVYLYWNSFSHVHSTMLQKINIIIVIIMNYTGLGLMACS